MEIEIIESFDKNDFENEVNVMIKGLEVQDIKYSTAICRDGTILYSAMIIWEV